MDIVIFYICIKLKKNEGKFVLKGGGVVDCKKLRFKGWFSAILNLRGGFLQSGLFKGWFSAIWPKKKVTYVVPT